MKKNNLESKNWKKRYLEEIKIYGEDRETRNKYRSMLYKEFFYKYLLIIVLATTEIISSNQKKKKIYEEYKELIQEYEDETKSYIEYVKSLNLSDLDNIMLLMENEWQTIGGYGNPEYDIPGYLRIDVSAGNPAVCRNLADDLTYKLNLLNEEYDAHNMVVYIKNDEWHLANIETNFYESNNNMNDDNKPNDDTEKEKQIIGNHMVTVITVPGSNIKLVLDPTNPGIGTIKNGKIYMFTNPDYDGIEYKVVGDLLLSDDFVGTNIDLIESYFVPCTVEEIEEEYGLEEENKSLSKIRKYSY